MLPPGQRGSSPLTVEVGAIRVQLVASAYPRVLIDAVDARGEWDVAEFDGRGLTGFRYGDMPPEIYREAGRALRREGRAFWPPALGGAPRQQPVAEDPSDASPPRPAEAVTA